MDPMYVSKIVEKTDDESEYIRAAHRILGNEYSQYIVDLKGECAPANAYNPPPRGQEMALQSGKTSLLTWNKKDEACDMLKQRVVQGKSITSNHKIMYISKYPMTLDDWAHTKNPSISYTAGIPAAIPVFIHVLQKLFQNSSEQLINLDLHAGNIFVRLDRGIQFGIADFGRCLLRQHVTGSGVLFYGKYLCENTAIYDLYASYNQIPLEARFLNFCYKKQIEHLSPGEFIRTWLLDRQVIEHQQKEDAILYKHKVLLDFLLTKHLFINMIETIQDISRKLRTNSTNPTLLTQSLSTNEKTVLEFIITRHAIISPMNILASVLMIAMPHVQGTTQGTTHLIEFVRRAMISPYVQVGSSLADAVTSVQRADMGIIWSDIVRGR